MEYLQGTFVEEDKVWGSRSAYTPRPDQVTWRKQIPTARDNNRKEGDFPNLLFFLHTLSKMRKDTREQ